jgi:peptide/nickel transport system permease protein
MNRYRSWQIRIGALLLGLIATVAVVGPFVAPYPADLIEPQAAFQPPSAAHPFGTDGLGRDLFSRVLIGARFSLGTSLGGLTIGFVLGTLAGLVGGMFGGWVDGLLMGFVEVFFAFPGILLALAIASMLGPGLPGAALAIGIASAPSVARVVRNATQVTRAQDYVLAAQAIGVPAVRLLWYTVLPNIARPVLALATILFQGALLATAGLAFIGLGAQPPAPEWGALLVAGRLQSGIAPWLTLFPGLALFLTALGATLVSSAPRQ